MITRGKIRTNGIQLAKYLLTKADNDNIFLFEIRGTAHPDDLRKSLLEMSLTSELTKSDKGLYHVQICPPIDASKSMTREDWLRAVEILEEETGFTNQKRALVMHEKNLRLHLHVVFERYDHDKGIMISDSFSRLAQDRARQRMEIEFEQERTPERNIKRPMLKEELTKLWHDTQTAQAFMEAVERKGYIIAAGTQRPYMVVDETGRSFNLVRELDKINTKEVRERFKTTKLIREKEAISRVRERQKADKKKVVEKPSTMREELKEAANDNIRQIEASTPPNANQVYSMSTSFSMKITDKNISQTNQAETVKQSTKEQRKAAEKQKVLDKIRVERLKKAGEFRENERDI